MSCDSSAFDRVHHSSGVAQRESRGNGCVERFIRTLKEQLLWLTRFATVDELDVALRDFAHRYNNHWILGRLVYKTPAQHRRSFLVEGGVIYTQTCVNNGILYKPTQPTRIPEAPFLVSGSSLSRSRVSCVAPTG